MNELEALMSRRWILKTEDKELYYKTRDAIGKIRKYSSEKLGCQIIDNSILIKMEKIPAKPESFMGITEFTSKEEYVYLCAILMFLEDRDAQEQFILSQVTEYISLDMPGDISDWTSYSNRRRLVRVLRYAVSQGIIKITDGTDEKFMNDAGGEVLYENTGASRFFMRNFPKDIMSYSHPSDFEQSEWVGVNEDRGLARRHSVYKKLMFLPAVYRKDGIDEDFEYLKNYGRRLSDELESLMDCQVHLHKGSAYIMVGSDCKIGETFPGSNSLADILLLCFAKIRENIEKGIWQTDIFEVCTVNIVQFEELIRSVKTEHGAGFSKKYREMPEGEFIKTAMDEMEKWMFIKRDIEQNQIKIYPMAGKIQGKYPDSFEGGSADEQQMAGK